MSSSTNILHVLLHVSVRRLHRSFSSAPGATLRMSCIVSLYVSKENDHHHDADLGDFLPCSWALPDILITLPIFIPHRFIPVSLRIHLVCRMYWRLKQARPLRRLALPWIFMKSRPPPGHTEPIYRARSRHHLHLLPSDPCSTPRAGNRTKFDYIPVDGDDRMRAPTFIF